MNAYVKYLGHLETTGALKNDIHDVQAAIAQVFAMEGRVRIAVDLFSDALQGTLRQPYMKLLLS